MTSRRAFSLMLIICILTLFIAGCNKRANKISTSIVPSENKTTEYTEKITTEEQNNNEQITDNIVDPPAEEDWAVKLLNSMSIEEKVGQMFIARCPASNADSLASQYALGGYILFASDFEGKSVEQVKTDITSYQNASKIGMFIGVDEEGGIVNRVSKYKPFREEPFKSPQDLYADGGFERIKQDTIEKSRLLKNLGINLNFAPVADVSTDSSDFIYKRTLGLGAKETSVYVKTVVGAMNKENVGSVLKHFPGYGGNEDTHEGIAYDKRVYDTFVSSDFLPFEAGIDAGVSMIMVAHNIVYCMDDKYPASLSVQVHRILREEMGFDGIIITDELSMEGVKQFANDEDVAVLAVQAGNDLLCCTNFQTQIQAVLDAVKQGKITEERIDESVLRILRLKSRLGILSNQ